MPLTATDFAALLLKGNPDQPRDEHGRWTSGGGGYDGGHPLSRPSGYEYWGGSHSSSSAITGRAASAMGIPGYRDKPENYDNAGNAMLDRVSTGFLQSIADSPGSKEPLYHGFQNVAGVDWKEGDTLKVPLLATSGDMDGSAGYGIRLDPNDNSGPPTVFEFPAGTKMAGYARWKKSDYEESVKDYGYAHTWSEAIVAGSYRITGTRTETHFNWQKTPYTVVRLEPTGYYDPTKGWEDV